MSPRTMAYFTSMCEPKAPARRTVSSGIHRQVVHEQADARVQRGLGKLDGAYVVLGHEDALFTIMQQVREGTPVGDDTLDCERLPHPE